MSVSRREYKISITVNHQRITKVIIDPHFEEKHATSISDEIILKLVEQLNGQLVLPDEESPPFSYFVSDMMELDGKYYKLVWLLEDDELYIGVVNAYRR